MECWSNGFMNNTPILQYSNTSSPILQHKKERNAMTPEDMRNRAEALFSQGFH